MNSPASADGAGGVGVSISGGTLINAGVIAGGYGANGGAQADAVLFGSNAGTLIVESGAAFIGNVVANSTVADVLEFSGTATTEFTGIGTSIVNFATIDFAAGAAWTIGGTAAGFAGEVIAGFGTGDTLDISGLTAGLSGTTVTADANGVVTLAESGSGSSSITLSGDANASFTLRAIALRIRRGV